ncbi:hypothetical protein [Tenacibaculum sp. C7A-26P2]|uniref:hypothetical protein n=1 Tax=Tenacibaculum sp. C7A-26P2 TaxID=3447504 RepID=UPI000EC00488|nr:hypothetical protein [Tenacibaculum sp.]
MNRKNIIIFLIFMCNYILAQEKLTWKEFSDVTFKSEYNTLYKASYLVPTFGKVIKSYEGKKIKIKGYFIDISGDGEMLILSKNPMAACYFCGGSGPESIIEIAFQKPPSFKTDEVIEVEGILKLNNEDVEHCNYILEKASGILID